jgi:hypothetical protein
LGIAKLLGLYHSHDDVPYGDERAHQEIDEELRVVVVSAEDPFLPTGVQVLDLGTNEITASLIAGGWAYDYAISRQGESHALAPHQSDPW